MKLARLIFDLLCRNQLLMQHPRLGEVRASGFAALVLALALAAVMVAVISP